jgi:hypothetical protein
MKLPLLSLALVLSLKCALLLGVEVENPALQNALQAADKLRVEAMQSGTPDQLGRVLSDDLRYAHSTGAVDSKHSLLETLAGKKTRYLEYVYEERNFTFPAPGIALMTGRARVKVEAGGTVMDNLLSFLAVWREEKDGWRFLAWQSCKIPPASK